MKSLLLSRQLVYVFILLAAFSLPLYSAKSAKAQNLSPGTTFIGSTLANDSIRSALSIRPDLKIDRIKWELTLYSNNDFILSTSFGEMLQNSNDFRNGDARTFRGKYSVAPHPKPNVKNEIYRLIVGKDTTLDLLKLNDNLFHLLTSQNELMVGDGGWSYTLNRKTPVEKTTLPILLAAIDETRPRVVFEGRTPCARIAEETALPVKAGCGRLKWGFTLNRDAQTLKPTTFTLRWVDPPAQGANMAKGTWTVLKGTPANPHAIIYRLQPEGMKPIHLLAGSENVLFLLDKNEQLYIGGVDFSYTLNRKAHDAA